MEIRKKILKTNYTDNEVQIFESISDLVNATLCPNYLLKCLKRQCTDCGIHKLRLLSEETEEVESDEIVKWEKFEKVDIKANLKGNITIQKLVLVKKESKIHHLFSHFLQLLKSFPFHQHRAT